MNKIFRKILLIILLIAILVFLVSTTLVFVFSGMDKPEYTYNCFNTAVISSIVWLLIAIYLANSEE